MRLTALRCPLLGLLVLGSGPAGAQRFPELRPGQPVQGTLTQGDPAFVERGRFKAYRLDATGGETYVLSLRSPSFDTYLSVAWSVGGLTETLAANDDAGDGTDSRLRWRAPATGSYIVVAQALTSDGTGPFTLSAEPAPPATTAAPRVIRPGETLQGALAETDAVDESDDTYYDSYTLRLRRGQRLRVEMRSDAFDTFLGFGRMVDGRWEPAVTDDDGAGEGTDSRLLITAPEDGEYLIRANSVEPGELGGYTLTVAERRPAGPAVPRPLTRGQEVRGSLDDGDAETAEGALYDLYTYAGRAGERLTIRLASEQFDTFLAFGRLVPGGFREIASNDDADGTDSALEVVLTSDGEYTVRAQALAPGAGGTYRIRVEAGP